MKLSIIIPVYKVEQYVEKCLLSCMNQDINSSEYEIIVVNDGSPDRSLEIISNIAGKCNNIKIISQKNQGQSVARNEGLKIAKGEYIWFVDSDDWIEDNCISELYNQCKNNELDVLSIESNDFIDGHIRVSSIFSKSKVDRSTPGRFYMISHELQLAPWSYIIRREFLFQHQLFFMNHIFHEDNELIPKIFYYAERFMSNSRALYYVFPNPTSTTRSINPKKSFDLIKVAQSHSDFIETKVRKKETNIVFCKLIGLAINSALYNSRTMNSFDKNKFYYELNKNRHLFYYMRKSKNLKYIFEAQLYLFSSHLFMSLYSKFSLKNNP